MGLPDLSSGFPGFPGGVSLELLIWGQGSLTKPESFPAAPRYLIGSHVGGVGWGVCGSLFCFLEEETEAQGPLGSTVG